MSMNEETRQLIQEIHDNNKKSIELLMSINKDLKRANEIIKEVIDELYGQRT